MKPLPPLRPCPFCGSARVRITSMLKRAMFYAYCVKCGAHGPFTDMVGTRRTAAELWNNRKGES